MLEAYYSDERVTLYRGRMEEVMPQLPLADCVVTDCTYGETALEWDKWVDGWPSIAAERLKKPGTMWCFGSFRMFTEHWAEFVEPFELVQDRIWEKQNGSNNMRDRFRRVHEMMVQFRHRKVKWDEVYHDATALIELTGTKKRIIRQTNPAHWNGIKNSVYASENGGERLMRSVVQAKNCHGYAINETEKPVSILRPLVKYSCPPGGLVVDPFAGSGSTLETCRQEGRRAIGIEMREEMCERAAKRLAESKELQLV